MQYQEFLEHIYKKYSGNVKLGLERMQGVLDDLAHPEAKLRGFHIAGTNGKGSVCASLEALCMQLPGGTGLNTSPHLINYTERFRINGIELDFNDILRSFQENEAVFEKWDASFFEISTAIAFSLFAQRNLAHNVIEVGLGGRLDATNLWTPDITAITTIGLDHVKTLGGTLEIIAGEKAGIIKQGIPVVIGNIPSGPLEVILDRAASQNAPVYLFGKDFNITNLKMGLDGITWDYSFGDYYFEGLHAKLLGEHQAHNISIALTCFLLYLQKLAIKPDEALIRKAIGEINWQGRMQMVHQNPLVILDGAHNVHGITALVNSLEQICPGKSLKFVLSILADKDYSEMIHLICKLAGHIYIAQNHSDRAATIEQQVEAVTKYAIPFSTANSVKEAYQLAISESTPDDVIIAGGSLYTVGELLSYLKQ